MSKKTKVASATNKRSGLEAREFVLKDDSGVTRAVLGMDAEGRPGLRFFDASGQSRLEAFLTDGDTPVLAMFDSQGTNNVALAMRSDAEAVFWLRGWQTSFRVDLDGEFGISAVSFGGKERSSIRVTLDNGQDHVGVQLTDRDGNELAEVSYDPDQGHEVRIESAFGHVDLTASGLTITGKNGSVVWSTTSSPPESQDRN